jgi:stalled ribosome alternative rescue factor ArfA
MQSGLEHESNVTINILFRQQINRRKKGKSVEERKNEKR